MPTLSAPYNKHRSNRVSDQGVCSGHEEKQTNLRALVWEVSKSSDLRNLVKGGGIHLDRMQQKKERVWVGDEKLSFGHVEFDES